VDYDLCWQLCGIFLQEPLAAKAVVAGLNGAVIDSSAFVSGSNEDVKSAGSSQVAADVWQVCFDLAQTTGVVDAEAKLELAAFALACAPPSALPEVLQCWQQLEMKVKLEPQDAPTADGSNSSSVCASVSEPGLCPMLGVASLCDKPLYPLYLPHEDVEHVNKFKGSPSLQLQLGSPLSVLVPKTKQEVQIVADPVPMAPQLSSDTTHSTVVFYSSRSVYLLALPSRRHLQSPC
jgi:hypothetical protein